MNVYEKIINIKAELYNAGLTKTGKNEYSNFPYFELGDFMPQAIVLFLKYKIDTTIQFDSSTRTAKLIATNCEEPFDEKFVSCEYEKAEMLGKGGTPSKVDAAQRGGATITYYRRYLYTILLDLIENDIVDQQDNTAPNKEKKPEKKPDETKPQKSKYQIVADLCGEQDVPYDFVKTWSEMNAKGMKVNAMDDKTYESLIDAIKAYR